MTRILLRFPWTYLLAIACLCWPSPSAHGEPLRVATYNASLNRNAAGQLIADLSSPDNLQARRVAETIQRVRPDVLLINEFDFDPQERAAELFQQHYLSVGQDTTGSGAPARPIHYPFRFVAPSNTGVASGVDFDGDGRNDDYGFGRFPGQFGMVVFSRFPIDTDQVRTFREFLWKDMPGHRIPANYTPLGIERARLSSKSHWDLPIRVGGKTVHLLASHPTPPVFDDPVFDENGRRNADEIRFWGDYVDPQKSGYIYDDSGARGGLPAGVPFVIVGDQNADPLDGDSFPGALDPLLTSPHIRATPIPSSEGAVEDARLEGGPNTGHRGDPAWDTADFGAPGNLRVDYVLPAKRLAIAGSGVFWPVRAAPYRPLISASDHRMVYVDLIVPEPSSGVLLAAALAVWLAGGRVSMRGPGDRCAAWRSWRLGARQAESAGSP